jgi:surfactin synthase thioesterase subunit
MADGRRRRQREDGRDVTAIDVTTGDWIRRFHPTEKARTRLVCFPHAGGSATFFHPVSARFAPDVDVVCLQYPGRQDRHRESPRRSIEVLADELADELAALTPCPTVFFGHSMGALAAFEVTRRLERDAPASAPAALLASGRRAPSTRRPEANHLLDDAGLLEAVRQLNGPDMQGLDEDFLALVLPALRADYEAVETYRPEPGAAVDVPLTALTGRDDPRTTVAEAQAWEGHTHSRFRLEVLPGDHFFLVPQAGPVCDLIDGELAAA